jgi:hypothetical protein
MKPIDIMITFEVRQQMSISFLDEPNSSFLDYFRQGGWRDNLP